MIRTLMMYYKRHCTKFRGLTQLLSCFLKEDILYNIEVMSYEIQEKSFVHHIFLRWGCPRFHLLDFSYWGIS